MFARGRPTLDSLLQRCLRLTAFTNVRIGRPAHPGGATCIVVVQQTVQETRGRPFSAAAKMLIKNEEAPTGVRGLQFRVPKRDGPRWPPMPLGGAPSGGFAFSGYVDLDAGGTPATNAGYEVSPAEQAFALPGLPGIPRTGGQAQPVTRAVARCQRSFPYRSTGSVSSAAATLRSSAVKTSI
jgi:hypothetical protein